MKRTEIEIDHDVRTTNDKVIEDRYYIRIESGTGFYLKNKDALVQLRDKLNEVINKHE